MMEPFEMPDADTLKGMSRDELTDLRQKASTALREMYTEATANGGTPTDEQLTELEALDGHLDTIDAAVGEVELGRASCRARGGGVGGVAGAEQGGKSLTAPRA